jgi:putative peptidoglycan lipid II flippase
MERLLRVMHKEWAGLHEAAFLLATAAICSQVLGLLRDRALAHHFGATSELDVYYAAFRIPDFLYASIASFVAVTVLIPFLVARSGKQNDEQDFLNTIFTGFVVVMGMLCVIAYFFMPTLVQYIVPGFDALSMNKTTMLARVLLLSPFLLGISNLLGAITQSKQRFFVFAIGPLLYNMGILFGIFVLVPHLGMLGVVYGVVLGALCHALIQIPPVIRLGQLPRLTIRPNLGIIRSVSMLSIPRTLALSAMHGATMVLLGMASRIDNGSIAVFMLAFNIQSIPLAIVGMSYSVAAFPTLTRMWNGGEHFEFGAQIITATRHIIFWSFPAIILFVVLRAQIVRSVLGSGAFDWTATRLTAALLAVFALSVVAQSLVLLYTRACYAMGKTRSALLVNVVGACMVVLCSYGMLYAFEKLPIVRYFLETLLRVADIDGTSVLTLALGYSLGLLLNLFLLARVMISSIPNLWSEVRHTFLHSFSASIVMGFVTYHGLQVFAPVFNQESFWGIFSQGLLAGLVGIASGLFVLRMMNNTELNEIHDSLKKKFWRSHPIAPDQEGL